MVLWAEKSFLILYVFWQGKWLIWSLICTIHLRDLLWILFFLWLVEIFHVTKLNSFNSSLRKTVDKFVYLFYFFFWLFYYNLAVIIGTELHSVSFVNDHNSHLGDLIRMMRHNCCAPPQDAIFCQIFNFYSWIGLGSFSGYRGKVGKFGFSPIGIC